VLADFIAEFSGDGACSVVSQVPSSIRFPTETYLHSAKCRQSKCYQIVISSFPSFGLGRN
jgi:hypothetical protein